MRDRRASFTLIELLIVIAIVAILSVVIILTLSPAELLKQSRDANRLSDMDTLNRALNLYRTDTGGSLGVASTTYLSLVDTTATSTAGTNCAGVGLAFATSTGWSYHCAASSTVLNVDGTGWLPVNFKSISYGTPLGDLPRDPSNISASGLYYMYVPSPNGWALAAMMESQKYLNHGANDGGYDPGRVESGSILQLISQGEALTGWWNFEEGSSTAATDSSGNGNTGTWSGTGVHSAAGKVGQYAGLFASSTSDVVDANVAVKDSAGTIMAWAYPTSYGSNTYVVQGSTGGPNRWYLYWQTDLGVARGNPSVQIALASSPPLSTWYHVVLTWEGGTIKGYLNGSLIGTNTFSSNGSDLASVRIGRQSTDSFQGRIDDVRIYQRALAPTEVAAIYNAEK